MKMIYDSTKSMSYFRSASRNEKLFEVNVLNPQGITLKNMNVSFIVHFCFRKYSSSDDTFSTHLISVIVSVSKLRIQQILSKAFFPELFLLNKRKFIQAE